MKTFARLIQHATLALATAVMMAACGGGDATPPPETEPPTVNVATNVLGTAAGNVTFTFTFSEDVGGSFTASDVTVTSGTASAFSKVSTLQYTLVVTPPANASGNITVNVAAGSFADLNGNLSTNAVTATQPFSTLAPAVSIASSAAGTTATGNVTFTFSFSKDVGTSFTADDVAVTGGTPGGFTMSSGTSATLVVAPPANAKGSIAVSVPAMSFTDSSGIGNVDAASAEQAFDTTGGVVPPPVGTGTLLLSFDEDPPAFSDMGAYGGALPSVEAGPAGGTGKALKILKPAGPDTWGGVYFTTARVPFTADRKKLTARVNATRAGAVIMLKVEVPGGANLEVAGTATGAANTWSTVTWDFSAANPALSYTVMAITPDVDRVTDGQAYFIDEITLAAAESVTPPPSGEGTKLLSFDEDPPAFSNMGAYGGAQPTVEAGPAGGNGNALKIFKPASPDTWGGTFFTVARVPFTAERKKITARVNATRAGAIIRMKVEVPGGAAVEVAGTATGAANTWGTVSWDFSAADLAQSYTVMAITPDADRATDGQTYFIDDITLAPAEAVVPPPPTGTAFLTFDEDPPAFSDMGAYGGAQPSVEAGPAGGSGKALKILKPAAPDTWGGVFFTTSGIPFTATAKTITARVYSTRAGAVISFKVEVPGGAAIEVLGTATGAANSWGTVTWNFSAADLSQRYKIIAITPDAARVTDGQAYYVDDITVVESAPPAGPVTIATLDEPGAMLQGFEGCWDSTVVNDPAGGSNKVGRVVKPGSGVPFYCGSTVVTVANGGFTPIPFTATATKLTVRLWSPDAGIPVRLKVEDIANPAKSVETEAMTAAAGAWQTLTFDFAKPVAGTAVLDLTTTYNKASIFFDFGTVGSGKTYYFDDITFVSDTGSNLVLVNFDERNYDNTQSQPSVLSGFGGAENSTLVGTSDGMPADGTRTGKSARVIKNPGEVWAGTSVQRKPNDAVPTIPFATGATKMSVRVYSAYAGVRVHLKVEQSGRPDFNSEVGACTTLTNAWETLVFDFGPKGKHFIPNGPCPDNYDENKPTAQLDVSKVYNKVNIFFDYGLGDAGYDAMPGTRTYYFDDLKFVGP